MAARRISDRLRIAACVAGALLRAICSRPRRLARALRWRLQPRFQRIELAPEDLHPADPAIAGDIIDGIFDLAGIAADCRGRSPFTVVPPSPAWEEELHAFAWLRHLPRAEADVAAERARVLVVEWSRYGAARPLSDRTDVVARRLAALLHNAPLLLQRASGPQHDRIVGYIEDDARRLYERMGEGPPGTRRITHLATLAEVLLAIAGAEDRAQPVLRRLDRELARLVLPDGTPADRNPASVVALLADLLPLRQILAERGIAASRVLMNSLDRLLPMLRFFRHTDGAMALFNGGGAVSGDLLANIFLLDDARARPPGQAHYGGYQRLESGRTVAVMDTGAPPPLVLSAEAHAAPLALEFSSGRNRFVVSTGIALDPRPDWRQAVRETAAHSGVTIGDRSVAGFLGSGRIADLIGPLMATRPWQARVQRQENQGVIAVVAGHDGYLSTFGLVHERTIRLSARGDRIDGRDRVVAERPGTISRAAIALRFHAHPDIRLTRLPNGVIHLIAQDGEAWEFHVKDTTATIEPSVFLADLAGPRTCDQIVVQARGEAELRWLFLRSAEARSLRRNPLAGLLPGEEDDDTP